MSTGPHLLGRRVLVKGPFDANLPQPTNSTKTQKPKFMRKAFCFRNEPGFEWDDKGCIVRVWPHSQSENHGIQVGWEIVEIQSEPVRRKGDNEHTRFHKRIAERLRLKTTYHGKYTVTFLFPLPDLDECLLREQEALLSSLDTLRDDDRDQNLEVLEKMNPLEKATILQRARACQGLLRFGHDELTVLFGEKTAADIQQNHKAWKVLQAGAVLDEATLRFLDFDYANACGDTPLHMASTAKAAESVLAAAAKQRPSSVFRPNKRGEQPLEALLRRVKAGTERSAILKMVSKCFPGALHSSLADGRPLRLGLREEERHLIEELNPHAIQWIDICNVLQAKDLKSLQAGYVHLLQSVSAAAPEVNVEDSAAIWSFLLCDHCFGALHTSKSSNSGGQSDVLEHSDISRQRLMHVWNTLKLVLTLSADAATDQAADYIGDFGTVKHSSMKHIAKGLFHATMGPDSQGFDPREPYREQLVALVNDLQTKSAGQLQEILKDLEQEDQAAAEAVANEIPYNQLHGLIPSGALVRQAPERLRLDAKLVDAVENIDPVPTPQWVLAQQIDMEMVNTLKDANCIEKARNLVELVSLKSNVLSPERLRFCYLHTAWIWAFKANHLDQVVRSLKQQLAITSSTLPCKGAGDFTVLSFRSRSEPKGLPRLLEKAGEAIEEELNQGRSTNILSMEPDLTKEPEDLQEEQLALLELLTPGCYVCDILGAEVSVGSYKDLMALYTYLRGLTLEKHGCQVVRTKNGFSRDAPMSAGGYRDLKLWLLVASEGFTVTAELQVHIHRILEQKKFMHLAYECFRGSFDHSHLIHTWQEIYFKPPPRSCCAALCAALTGKGNAKVVPL